MAEGIGLFVYPAKDVSLGEERVRQAPGRRAVRGQAVLRRFPEWRAGDLHPNGRSNGPIAYRHTDDIEGKLRELLEAGAQARKGVRDVGGGRLIALVTDPDGNVIGPMRHP